MKQRDGYTAANCVHAPEHWGTRPTTLRNESAVSRINCRGGAERRARARRRDRPGRQLADPTVEVQAPWAWVRRTGSASRARLCGPTRSQHRRAASQNQAFRRNVCLTRSLSRVQMGVRVHYPMEGPLLPILPRSDFVCRFQMDSRQTGVCGPNRQSIVRQAEFFVQVTSCPHLTSGGAEIRSEPATLLDTLTFFRAYSTQWLINQ